ncbi:hypothetical protein Hanom_Chr13g01205271 [Helianthus anomalus]
MFEEALFEEVAQHFLIMVSVKQVKVVFLISSFIYINDGILGIRKMFKKFTWL